MNIIRLKKHMTLIEIMIVMALIGIISGVIMYNMNGSIKKGKDFASNQKAKQILHVLQLEAMETSKDNSEIVRDWENIVKESPFFDKTLGDDITKDSYGNQFNVMLEEGEIKVLVRS